MVPADKTDRLAELRAILLRRDFREVVDQANVQLATGDRSARGGLHLLRLLAIDRGALGDVETREKEALTAATSPRDGIDLRLALGRIALRRADFASALRLGVNMKSLLQPTDLVRRAQALRLEAMAKWSQGALHESIALHGTAVKLCVQASDTLGQAMALNDRGLVRGYAGDYQQAIVDHQAATECLLTAAHGQERDEVCAQVDNDHGFALWNLAQHEGALAMLTRSLQMRRELRDLYGQAITQNNLGNVHRACGRSELAIEHYESAITLCKQSGNPLYEAIALNNLGQISIDLGKLEQAESRFQDALSITERLGDKIRQADNHGNLGAIYLRLEQPSRALEALTLAVEMRRAQRDLAYLVVDQSALAVALARTNAGAHAEDTLAEVESALERGQQGIEQPQAVFLNLYFAYHALGATGPAAKALQRAQEAMALLRQAIPGEAERDAFLKNVEVNRTIVSLSETKEQR